MAGKHSVDILFKKHLIIFQTGCINIQRFIHINDPFRSRLCLKLLRLVFLCRIFFFQQIVLLFIRSHFHSGFFLHDQFRQIICVRFLRIRRISRILSDQYRSFSGRLSGLGHIRSGLLSGRLPGFGYVRSGLLICGSCQLFRRFPGHTGNVLCLSGLFRILFCSVLIRNRFLCRILFCKIRFQALLRFLFHQRRRCFRRQSLYGFRFQSLYGFRFLHRLQCQFWFHNRL